MKFEPRTEEEICRSIRSAGQSFLGLRMEELISRIKNVLRRKSNLDNCITVKDIKIDTEIGKVYRENKEIVLTKLEYKILYNLFVNKNKIITREEILNDIWDIAGNFVEDNTLTVYIKRIR